MDSGKPAKATEAAREGPTVTAKTRDEPTYANDPDGLPAPSTETTPGTIPQTPLPGRAPSRPQAERAGRDGPEGGPGPR